LQREYLNSPIGARRLSPEMSGGQYALIEVLLVFGGVLVFAWWQFRDLKKYKTGEKSDEQDRAHWKNKKD
jgi:hypothetical protein